VPDQGRAVHASPVKESEQMIAQQLDAVAQSRLEAPAAAHQIEPGHAVAIRKSSDHALEVRRVGAEAVDKHDRVPWPSSKNTVR